MKIAFWRKATSLLLGMLLLSSLILGARPAQAARPAQGPADPVELGTFLDGVIQAEMARNHIQGAVMAVVKDGSLIYSRGYGSTDLEGRKPVDPERTLFRPGSISKLFVWTAVMQLVEQGKLSLDADVNQYLDYTIPATFPQPITLTHVMTHTTGFEDVGADLFKLTAEEVRPLDEYLKTHLPQRVFPPGEIGAYSNYATAMAGYIVARVSGMPFEQYVEQNILQPLGMQHSTFRQPLPEGLAGDMSGGFNFTNGAFLQGKFEYVTGFPAGSMSVTAADMARFMIAHLQNGAYEGGRILQEDTAVLMHQHLFSHDPRMPGMAHGFFENMINGQRVISHGGDTVLFHSGLYLLVDQNVGLFISTNSTGGASVPDAVLKAFLDRYYPVDAVLAPTPAADFQQRYGKLVGQYTFSRSNFSTVEKVLIPLTSPVNVSLTQDGYLVISLGGRATQYVEVAPGLFQARYEPANLVALRENPDGSIYLLPTGPFGFIKTPWYGANSLHGFLLVFGVLLFLGSMTGWIVQFFGGLRKKVARRAGAVLARWAGALFGLAFLALLAGFGAVFGSNLPAYGVPAVFFQDPGAQFKTLITLPWLMAGLWLLMLIFCGLAWLKGYWRLSGRLHYTLLVVEGLALMWMLVYWNFWL